MKPIVITTPRTGSDLFCKILGNLSQQHFNYKNILYEFFTISPHWREEFVKENNTIICKNFCHDTSYKWNDINSWYDSAREEKLKRLELLKDDTNYLIKIYPVDLEDEINEVIKQYDYIYLERKNKFKQLLSILAATHTKLYHFNKNDNFKIEEIYYDKKLVDIFFTTLEKYKKFKEDHPSVYPVVYYEDFIANGANEDFIIKLLNLPITKYQSLDHTRIPSQYSAENIEDLILNKSEWLEDRDSIIKKLSFP
jgi:LPS sulfotransferase NodH